MEALAEDLLMSGAYNDARTVTAALATRSRTPSALGRDACRQALDRLAESLAMLDTAALLGDVDAPARTTIRAIVEDIGPAAIDALIEALGLVPSDVGVTALTRVIARRGFFGRRKLRTLKERGVGALARIGTPQRRLPWPMRQNRGPFAEKNCRRP
jgi:hypothetical protein